MGMGQFVLHRFNGDEIYSLCETTIQARRDEEGVRIVLDANTEGAALRTTPDTAEHPTQPNATVTLLVKKLNVGKLVGQRFEVPEGQPIDDELAFLYYYDHESIDENVVEFLARREDFFHVKWSAVARDVNFYDGTKPKTKLEIEGWFRFTNLQLWPD